MEEIWKNVHSALFLHCKIKICDSYFKEKASNVKCHAGNSRNVDLWVFAVNYTMTCSFSLLKTATLTVFYCKIALNVIAVIQLYELFKLQSFVVIDFQ